MRYNTKIKAAAIMLIMTMVVSLFSGFSAAAQSVDDAIQAAVTKLASKDAAERQQITGAVLPLLMTDIGLDSLDYYLETYDPNATDMFNVMIGKLLGFLDAETFRSIIGYLRVVDAKIRESYLTSFMQRETRSLSSNAADALNRLIGSACSRYDGLAKIMQEDSISAGVVAKLMEALYVMNHSQALLKSGPDGFAVNVIAPELEALVDAALREDGIAGIDSARTLADAAVNELNAALSSEEKTALKTVLGEIGVYQMGQMPAETPGANAGPGNGGVKPTSTPTEPVETVSYELLASSAELGYDIIEICSYVGGEKQPYGAFEQTQTVSIAVTGPNAMLYRIVEEEGALVPIKYNAYIDGQLICKVDAAGKYAVKLMAPYFEDAVGWGKDYIEALYHRGVISGKEAHIFAPESNITREEFVKLVVALFDMQEDVAAADFSDVERNAWYAPYIAAAQKNGFISGVGDGMFGVGRNITRQDMAKILYGIMHDKSLLYGFAETKDMFVDAAQIADYAKEAVEMLANYNILSGDENGCFRPEDNATRQEAAKLIYNLLALYAAKQ